MEPRLQTDRLLLRRWHKQDLIPFAQMNADPVVMEHFPSTLSAAESTALATRIEDCFAQRGYGLWAVEVPGQAPFIGFVGLWPVRLELPFGPAVEVGWRLAHDFWGHGYATEAAEAAIAFGFQEVGLEEVVSYTAQVNTRSRRVMERLGMSRDPTEDFEHPLVPQDSLLRRHVLFRLRRAQSAYSG
ncbi:MAG: GNAT family N-acetyltransferase [Solirubrobacteraceae bacterium]